MTKRITLVGGLLAACLAAAPGVRGQSEATDKDKAQIAEQAKALRAIPVAMDLGRHGQETNSALELVTAASMLSKYGLTPAKLKPTITEPDGPKPEGDDNELPPLSLKAEAAKFLAAARAAAGDDKEVLALIARVEGQSKATRSSGYPRSISRNIRAGVTHTFSVAMTPGTQSTVAVLGNGKNTYTLSVTGAATGRHGSYTGPNPACTWVPGKAQQWNIEVTNNGPGVGSYTLTHN